MARQSLITQGVTIAKAKVHLDIPELEARLHQITQEEADEVKKYTELKCKAIEEWNEHFCHDPTYGSGFARERDADHWEMLSNEFDATTVKQLKKQRTKLEEKLADPKGEAEDDEQDPLPEPQPRRRKKANLEKEDPLPEPQPRRRKKANLEKETLPKPKPQPAVTQVTSTLHDGVDGAELNACLEEIIQLQAVITTSFTNRKFELEKKVNKISVEDEDSILALRTKLRLANLHLASKSNGMLDRARNDIESMEFDMSRAQSNKQNIENQIKIMSLMYKVDMARYAAKTGDFERRGRQSRGAGLGWLYRSMKESTRTTGDIPIG